jgi:hypothetical protein
MFELYLRCPVTGEPIYAGFHANVNDGIASGAFMRGFICPACGGMHDWRAEAVWSAIPVALPLHEAPVLGVSAEQDKQAKEKLPKVA